MSPLSCRYWLISESLSQFHHEYANLVSLFWYSDCIYDALKSIWIQSNPDLLESLLWCASYCCAGFLCISRGLSLPSHVCPAGSYCPGGADGSQHISIPCSPGNMCPPRSDRQVPCSPGTYQDLSGQVQKTRINGCNFQKDCGHNSQSVYGNKEDMVHPKNPQKNQTCILI